MVEALVQALPFSQSPWRVDEVELVYFHRLLKGGLAGPAVILEQ